MTRAKDISKILTDADLSGTLDVAGAFTSQGIDDNADATAITIDSSERVGIGTTSPSEKLEINSGIGNIGAKLVSTDSLAVIAFKDNSTTDVQYLGANGNNLVFAAGAIPSERMRIADSDSRNVLSIGDTAVYTGVISTTATNASLISMNSGGGSEIVLSHHDALSTSGLGAVTFNRGVDALAYMEGKCDGSTGSGSLRFGTRAQGGSLLERMKIDASGNVGIGTSSPSFESGTGGGLEINNSSGNGSHLKLTDSASGSGGTNGFDLYAFNTSGYIENYEAGSIVFRNNGSERMRINSSGNVGIGNTSPSAKLDVTGAIEADDKITIAYEAGSSDWELESTSGDDFTISRNGSQKLLIDGSTSNVGIGTNNPLNLLQVAGAIGLSSAVMASSTTSGDFAITISNQFGLTGSNWRESGLLLYYHGVDTSLANSTVLFTSIRLRGLNTWSSAVQSNIIGAASITDSNQSSTGLTITVDVPDSNNGIVFVLVLGTNKPSVSITA